MDLAYLWLPGCWTRLLDQETVSYLYTVPQDVSGLTNLVPGKPDSDHLEIVHPSILLQESAYIDAAAKVKWNLVLAFAIDGKLDSSKFMAAAETIASWQPALRPWFPGHRNDRGALVARLMPIAAVHVQFDGPAPAEEAAMATLVAQVQASAFRPNSCAVRFCLISRCCCPGRKFSPLASI